ncbi:hypothetical protein EV401DRAFT_1804675, partial [Pisolithus croceorrhizus]
CTRCLKEGIYKCMDCLHQPLLCTDCCQIVHNAHPFHQIKQWTGLFFEKSALHMTSLQLQLGHNGRPCPSASTGQQGEPLSMNEDDWEDIDEIPLHLRPPMGSKYLTIIDVTGIHFVLVQPCQCEGADSYHQQLFQAKLCTSTFEKPSTAFTFTVLDDFLQDNLECGTSGMNYYSKLHRLTSNVFPHLVPNRYWELLRLVWQWHLLKLLKWNSFQKNMDWSSQGDLALFCPACLQPGINVDPSEDLEDWKYMQTFVMDGNFKAEHMHEKQPDDQVWLMDGRGFMVTHPTYQQYVKATPHISEKSACNNHRAISQANITHGKLSSTGICATACARHGCFYPHSVVDFQKGERQLNMDYSLSNALSYNMTGIKHVVSRFSKFRPLCKLCLGLAYGMCMATNRNVMHDMPHYLSRDQAGLMERSLRHCGLLSMFLSWKLKAAWTSVLMAREAFNRLDEGVPSHNCIEWDIQAESTLNRQVQDASVMDIFEIQLKKAPTVRSVKLRLLQSTSQNGTHHGAASWLTRGLAIEEAEIMLSISQKDACKFPTELKQLAMARRADRLASKRSSFIADGQIYLDLVHELGHSEDYDDYDNQPGDGIGGISHEQDVFCEDADSNGSADDAMEMEPLKTSTLSHLPLPSNIGVERCCAAGVYELTQMELQLRVGQANDVLHGLCLALADKAVVFRGVVRQAKSYSMRMLLPTMRGWQMVNSIESSVKQHATIYKRCREAMIALGADADTLTWFQELLKCHLSINTAAFTQNAHDHRHSSLPWFWSMDIERDTRSKTWLTEFYRIHWLRAKAIKDWWEEEEALLVAEFQWAINSFKYHARKWS